MLTVVRRMRRPLLSGVVFAVIGATSLSCTGPEPESQPKHQSRASAGIRCLSHAQADREGRRGPFRVNRVVDGDTVVLECDRERVKSRLIGVDTPETVKENTPVQCGGPEASAFTERNLKGRSVWVSFDPGQRHSDPYARALVYLWINGDLFNVRLIREGYARENGYGKNYMRAAEFRRVQASAQVKKLGVWSCPRPS